MTDPAIVPGPTSLRDSRRLTGPNLLWDKAGAVIDVTLDDATGEAGINRWAQSARLMLEAVGWPGEAITVRRFPGGASLAISAPLDGLYPATELNEWACGASAGRPAPTTRSTGRRRRLGCGSASPMSAIPGSWPWPRWRPNAASCSWQTTTWCQPAWASDLTPGPGLLSPTPPRLTGRGFITTRSLSLPGATARPLRLASSRQWSNPPALSRNREHRRRSHKWRDGRIRGFRRSGVPHGAPGSTGRVGNPGDRARGDPSAWIWLHATPMPQLSPRSRGSPGRVRGVESRDTGRDQDGSALGRPVIPSCSASDDAGLVEIESSLVGARSSGSHSGPRTPSSQLISLRRRHRRLPGKDRLVLDSEASGGAIERLANIPVHLPVPPGTISPTPWERSALRPRCTCQSAQSAQALRSFQGTAGDNPGRLNIYQLGGVTVVVDFAHNPHGLSALIEMAQAPPAKRRLACWARPVDGTTRRFASWPGSPGGLQPDRCIAKEMAEYIRGRSASEIPGLDRRGVDETRRHAPAGRASTYGA